MAVEIEAASPRHINRVAKAMRPIDQLECAAFGHDPKGALRTGLTASTLAWSVMIDGKPEAMFGLRVVSLLGGLGRPWLLGSERFVRAKRELLKLSPEFVAAMQRETPVLENWIARENNASRRYLTALGFEIHDEPAHYGGVDFLRFSKGE